MPNNICFTNQTTSTHGGHAIGTGENLKSGGSNSVVSNDTFICPEHGHEHILPSIHNLKFKVGGLYVAVSNDKVSCGATLISTSPHQIEV